jgi:hypothetical protein
VPVAVVVGAVAVVFVFSWFVTGFHSFTWPARFTVLGSAVVLLRTVDRTRTPPDGPPSVGSWSTGLGIWVALIVLLGAWELNALFRSPRSVYPTLSSLADIALGHHPVRMVAFVGWLALGWDMARR